jgi:hypothetical protein
MRSGQVLTRMGTVLPTFFGPRSTREYYYISSEADAD